jgi:hypothetical protein
MAGARGRAEVKMDWVWGFLSTGKCLLGGIPLNWETHFAGIPFNWETHPAGNARSWETPSLSG